MQPDQPTSTPPTNAQGTVKVPTPVTAATAAPSPTEKAAKLVLGLVVASFVVLVVGFFFGYVSILGIALGAYAGFKAQKLESLPLLAAGYAAAVLNAVNFIFTVVRSL